MHLDDGIDLGSTQLPTASRLKPQAVGYTSVGCNRESKARINMVNRCGGINTQGAVGRKLSGRKSK